MLILSSCSCNYACEVYLGSQPIVTSFDKPKSTSQIQIGDPLPLTLSKGLQASNFSPEMTKILIEARQITLIKGFCGFEVGTSAEIGFLDARCGLIFHHIDWISTKLTASVASNVIKMGRSILIEQSVCYGLWLYYKVILQSEPLASALAAAVSQQLKSVLLQKTLITHWEGPYTLLIWVLFIGACAANGSLLYDWYLLQLNNAIKALSIKSWKGLKFILREVFWAGRCESLGYALWQDLESRYCHQTLA